MKENNKQLNKTKAKVMMKQKQKITYIFLIEKAIWDTKREQYIM